MRYEILDKKGRKASVRIFTENEAFDVSIEIPYVPTEEELLTAEIEKFISSLPKDGTGKEDLRDFEKIERIKTNE